MECIQYVLFDFSVHYGVVHLPCCGVRPCTRTLLFWEPSTGSAQPWETETGAVCQCIRDLKDLGVRRKGAPRPAPHYRSCQPLSTVMRGPTVAWGFQQLGRWLILHSSHSAPVEPQLLSSCHHTDSDGATVRRLPGSSSLARGRGSSWGLVAAEAGTQSPRVPLASRVWRCSHSLWNAGLGVLEEGPPERERRKGGGRCRGGWPLNSAIGPVKQNLWARQYQRIEDRRCKLIPNLWKPEELITGTSQGVLDSWGKPSHKSDIQKCGTGAVIRYSLCMWTTLCWHEYVDTLNV